MYQEPQTHRKQITDSYLILFICFQVSFETPHCLILGFASGSDGKNLPAVWEIQVQSLGQEDPVEKGMLPTPVFLPGESILWTEEPGRLQSMGVQRVGHNRAANTFIFFVALFQRVKKELKALCMLLHINLVYFIYYFT